MKSTEFLQAAIDVQAERGKQYDTPEGERSMGRTVAAFNVITGRDLTEAEGWLLLQVLKDVRQWQNPTHYHHDSALDCVAYASLKAEALTTGKQPSEKGKRVVDKEAREAFIKSFEMPSPAAPFATKLAHQADTDWIEWNGGECPVPSRTRVEIQTRSGMRKQALARAFEWDSCGEETPFDIIAYRLL